MRCAAFWGGGEGGSVAQSSEEMPNIAAMTIQRNSNPYRLTAIGARMMNPSRKAPLNVNVKSEFATIRSRLRTMPGIVADSAGTKKIVTAATRKFTRYAAVRLVPATS